MGSKADYGNLSRIVVGVAENYAPHVWGWKSDGATLNNLREASAVALKVIGSRIREEVIEDLENYANFFLTRQIEVLRPPRTIDNSITENAHYLAFGNDFYNMRDLQIVLGDSLLLAAPSCPSRQVESLRLRPFLQEAASVANLSVIESPRPNLQSNPVQEFIFDGYNLIPKEYVEGEKLGGDYERVWHRLTENEIMFDAANIARFKNQILFLVSSTGNKTAFDWVSKQFSQRYKFSWTDVYRSSHIDSTIIPLSEEKVLVNGARVNPGNLPKEIADMKVLYFEEVAPIPESEREFHKLRKRAGQEIKSLGFDSNLTEMSSPWAGLNVLVVEENLIAVESRQHALIQLLEREGFEVYPVQFRHPYTFLGGLHCTTLDLTRSSPS